jgi:5'-deoxynucleotidase YfbR-like HD superfamily hydrolase
MQPTDAADKRPPFQKIASSIRAAILMGEFEPGAQLPPGRELAEFFGVAPMTVHQAVRSLRDEGFVTSRAGSGVFVSSQPATPELDHREHPLSGVADFLHEMGQLKKVRRAGWFFAGVSDPETVAEHTFRAAIVGLALAHLAGADPARTAALCLLHDSAEARIGDIEAVGRAYVATASPEAVNTHQTSAMPEALAQVFQGLVREYEAEDSIESHLAHDADKLETLLQAREYQTDGQHDTLEWQESTTAVLRTDAGKELAAAITATTPRSWWSAFGKSYTELRRTTRGRHSPRPRTPPVSNPADDSTSP